MAATAAGRSVRSGRAACAPAAWRSASAERPRGHADRPRARGQRGLDVERGVADQHGRLAAEVGPVAGRGVAPGDRDEVGPDLALARRRRPRPRRGTPVRPERGQLDLGHGPQVPGQRRLDDPDAGAARGHRGQRLAARRAGPARTWRPARPAPARAGPGRPGTGRARRAGPRSRPPAGRPRRWPGRSARPSTPVTDGRSQPNISCSPSWYRLGRRARRGAGCSRHPRARARCWPRPEAIRPGLSGRFPAARPRGARPRGRAGRGTRLARDGQDEGAEGADVPGRIRDEDIALVRERSAVDEVIGEHLQLRNAGGGSLKGLCPFHDEKTPSFNVTPARGLWYCFSCAEGGDVIKFVQKIDNLGFAEAVERLAARIGIELRYEQGGHVPGQEHTLRRRLVEAHRAAADFYAEQLATPAAAAGREFLSARGFERADADEVRRRVRARRVGRADPAPARPRLHRAGPAGRGTGPAGPARRHRHVPRAADLAHRRPGRRRARVRRPQAEDRRRRPQVPQHPRDAAVQEELGAVRGRPGPARDLAAPPGGDRRGLHRRDGLPPGRHRHRRGHQRHVVRRGPHRHPAPPADGRQPVPRRGDLHLRRRRGRPEGGAARVQPRGEVRHPDLRRRPARRAGPVRPAAEATATPRSGT